MQQAIVDMSRMSPAEIANVHMASAEPVCGLYTDVQLRGPAPVQARSATWRRSPAMVSLLSLLLTEPADAAPVGPPTIERFAGTDAEDRIGRREWSPAHADTLWLRGRVVVKMGEKLEGVAFVNVHVVGTTLEAATDYDGRFMIDLSSLDGTADSITVEVQYIGYTRQERRVRVMQDEELVFDLTNAHDHELVFAVTYKKPPLHKRVWRSIQGLFASEE
ncbi:MAG: carboxypeptidase-like regulatory domain-containing protein [Flavobacteriales bacterium]|nr:carboxypeptidase-like regulatory domain-containing protein [Flavobacteriales bacterium]